MVKSVEPPTEDSYQWVGDWIYWIQVLCDFLGCGCTERSKDRRRMTKDMPTFEFPLWDRPCLMQNKVSVETEAAYLRAQLMWRRAADGSAVHVWTGAPPCAPPRLCTAQRRREARARLPRRPAVWVNDGGHVERRRRVSRSLRGETSSWVLPPPPGFDAATSASGGWNSDGPLVHVISGSIQMCQTSSRHRQ